MGGNPHVQSFRWIKPRRLLRGSLLVIDGQCSCRKLFKHGRVEEFKDIGFEKYGSLLFTNEWMNADTRFLQLSHLMILIRGRLIHTVCISRMSIKIVFPGPLGCGWSGICFQ